jgi:starvation-inducible DNA-binding protein
MAKPKSRAKSRSGSPNRELANGLADLLADTYATYLATQGAHWNVEGPNFPQLHALFQTQYEELALAIDAIAEKIRSLGHYAPASYDEFARRSAVRPPKGTLAAEDYLDALHQAHQTIAGRIERILPLSLGEGLEDTNDFLIARKDAHGKAAWMLRATLGRSSRSL